ncbi:hypothetical protein SLI_4754 [Streptomyces lividans 1326]|uniref:Uncharacterized protein n=1 Tax=Streptomyces lividans 1326 TaxID=1200984 RepID=A0A7U9DX35_STRLI|nr:hypothetical protein SLI_4754 [Streptomyces lividans 1326]
MPSGPDAAFGGGRLYADGGDGRLHAGGGSLTGRWAAGPSPRGRRR